ncbi:MAG TPA: septal ring lytic transglycosylase RlpA family protein [Reyranella sp.]|nr:septal ring lytic transglycosylase RlpA family protein [Reyranella sp.]
MSVPSADRLRRLPTGRAPIKIVRTCSSLLLVAASLAACSHRGGGGGGQYASRGSYKVGAPYTIDGVTYVPQEEFNHVETGVASWYGPGFHGKYTANGETYDQHDHTAAHRTLQMPSIVRVTNLDNGRSTVVRINDRGPYARSRIIDLSRAAADDLGIVRNGTAHVRIDQLPAESMAVKQIAMNGGSTAEQDEVVARAGSYSQPPAVMVASANPPPAPPPTPAVEVQASYPRQPVAATTDGRSPTIASLAARNPATAPVVPPTGGFYVQAGAFSTMGNAERQRSLITSYGAVEIMPASAGGREVYRVRLGPYTTSDAAGIVADRLKRSGYGDARVVAD